MSPRVGGPETEVLTELLKTFLKVVRVDIKNVDVDIELTKEACVDGFRNALSELPGRDQHRLNLSTTTFETLCNDEEFINNVKQLIKQVVTDAILTHMDSEEFTETTNEIIEDPETQKHPLFKKLLMKIQQKK